MFMSLYISTHTLTFIHMYNHIFECTYRYRAWPFCATPTSSGFSAFSGGRQRLPLSQSLPCVAPPPSC